MPADNGFFHLTAAGHRLRARRIGAWEGDRPVLVLLHEGLGSIGQWGGFPEELARRCGLPALVYDRYGYGGSEPVALPRPDDFLEIEAQEALPELLAACNIERPVLVGHSDGGTIALLHAAAFPDRPLACITMAAHVLLEPVTRAGVLSVMRRWAADEAFRASLSRHHGEGTEAMFRGWAETWSRETMRDWDIRGRLAAIRCPVLAIQGEADDHGTAAQVDEIVARVAGPAEAMLIPGCGHAPHHEAREAVLGRIGTFIDALR